ncbi:hypothetical protein [Sphingomonas adhaesiva]|uniref:hypothetical protein n=1 Tax=Sphingomonas adhaesiva TaxID=28212 RepID=UPI002FF6F7E6
MKKPQLINTKAELRVHTLRFAREVPALSRAGTVLSSVIANGCSHAVEWVAFKDKDGVWKVAFCKFAAYKDMNFEDYDRFRKTDMSGTEAKRRVEKLGGTYYSVSGASAASSDHPAVMAVQDTCALFGKAPKATAKVRVFVDDDRDIAKTILAAAISAANLSHQELDELIEDVKSIA